MGVVTGLELTAPAVAARYGSTDASHASPGRRHPPYHQWSNKRSRRPQLSGDPRDGSPAIAVPRADEPTRQDREDCVRRPIVIGDCWRDFDWRWPELPSRSGSRVTCSSQRKASGQATEPRRTPLWAAQNCNDNWLPAIIAGPADRLGSCPPTSRDRHAVVGRLRTDRIHPGAARRLPRTWDVRLHAHPRPGSRHWRRSAHRRRGGIKPPPFGVTGAAVGKATVARSVKTRPSWSCWPDPGARCAPSWTASRPWRRS